MEKYSLEIQELFGDPTLLTNRVLEQISEIKLDDLFERTTKGIQTQLNELRFGLKELDPTLLGALENSSGKIEGSLNQLKEKSLRHRRRGTKQPSVRSSGLSRRSSPEARCRNGRSTWSTSSTSTALIS